MRPPSCRPFTANAPADPCNGLKLPPHARGPDSPSAAAPGRAQTAGPGPGPGPAAGISAGSIPRPGDLSPRAASIRHAGTIRYAGGAGRTSCADHANLPSRAGTAPMSAALPGSRPPAGSCPSGGGRIGDARVPGEPGGERRPCARTLKRGGAGRAQNRGRGGLWPPRCLGRVRRGPGTPYPGPKNSF